LFKTDNLFKNNVLLFLYLPRYENMNTFSDFHVDINTIDYTKLNTKQVYPNVHSIRYVYNVDYFHVIKNLCFRK